MQDRIKQMAEEAGFDDYELMPMFTHFAALVAKDCAKVALEHPCEERSARRPQIASAILARYGIKE